MINPIAGEGNISFNTFQGAPDIQTKPTHKYCISQDIKFHMKRKTFQGPAHFKVGVSFTSNGCCVFNNPVFTEEMN